MKSVALNVGANSNTPGGRGPIYSDGSFEYVPIAEADKTVSEPTYSDLGLADVRPEEIRDTVIHFDPEFPEIGFTDHYTYGDRHPPKTTEIAKLEEGDILFFYATLDYASDHEPNYDWINNDWGAYIIGHFTLEYDPVSKEEYHSLPEEVKKQFATNAHVRREEFDAEYLVLGNSDESRLYETPLPFSKGSGVEANEYVTEHSEDSGEGPWYRRPLRFDKDGTRTILQAQREFHSEVSDEPTVVSSSEFDRSQLGHKGQLQFFFHAPESEFPVRDIIGRGKTEPHIEEQAENYCNECYQPNIRGFLKNNSRRYLFLFTKCENSDLVEFYDERYIVGYIEKERKLDMGDHLAVQGPTRLVRFENAIPLSEVAESPRYVRMKKFDEATTRQLVNQLDQHPNVFEKCIEEVERLKEEDESGDVPPPSSCGC
ncbi:hypothetical protein HTG_00055 [Natrinema mahii]|nr:hypothetical protein HTG_00055 [Natrinema mahii]